MSIWVVENAYTEDFIDESRHVTDSFYSARKFNTFEAAEVMAEWIDPDGLRGWQPKEYLFGGY